MLSLLVPRQATAFWPWPGFRPLGFRVDKQIGSDESRGEATARQMETGSILNLELNLLPKPRTKLAP